MNKQRPQVLWFLPGAGFDVVPSDCLAQYLKQQLPDAQELILAIATMNNQPGSGVGVSRGTAKSMLDGISIGTMFRDKGVLQKAPMAGKTKAFPFGADKPKYCSLISWGDISSAWRSTGIPHIETYMALPKQVVRLNKLIYPIKWLFKWAPIKKLIANKINKLPEGPSAEARQNSVSKIYGEVKNAKGEKVSALLTTPNGYALTAMSVVNIMQKILAGNAPSGFQTPSTAYTKDLIMEIPGVSRVDL